MEGAFKRLLVSSLLLAFVLVGHQWPVAEARSVLVKRHSEGSRGNNVQTVKKELESSPDIAGGEHDGTSRADDGVSDYLTTVMPDAKLDGSRHGGSTEAPVVLESRSSKSDEGSSKADDSKSSTHEEEGGHSSRSGDLSASDESRSDEDGGDGSKSGSTDSSRADEESVSGAAATTTAKPAAEGSRGSTDDDASSRGDESELSEGSKSGLEDGDDSSSRSDEGVGASKSEEKSRSDEEASRSNLEGSRGGLAFRSDDEATSRGGDGSGRADDEAASRGESRGDDAELRPEGSRGDLRLDDELMSSESTKKPSTTRKPNSTKGPSQKPSNSTTTTPKTPQPPPPITTSQPKKDEHHTRKPGNTRPNPRPWWWLKPTKVPKLAGIRDGERVVAILLTNEGALRSASLASSAFSKEIVKDMIVPKDSVGQDDMSGAFDIKRATAGATGAPTKPLLMPPSPPPPTAPAPSPPIVTRPNFFSIADKDDFVFPQGRYYFPHNFRFKKLNIDYSSSSP